MMGEGTTTGAQVKGGSGSGLELEEMRGIARVMSGKWCLHVLASISAGTKSYSELASLTGIDHKQLGRALQNLHEGSLLAREVDVSKSPIRVRYRLTPLGSEALAVLDHLARKRRELLLTAEGPD